MSISDELAPSFFSKNGKDAAYKEGSGREDGYFSR